jgi:hypothetical protein
VSPEFHYCFLSLSSFCVCNIGAFGKQDKATKLEKCSGFSENYKGSLHTFFFFLKKTDIMRLILVMSKNTDAVISNICIRIMQLSFLGICIRIIRMKNVRFTTPIQQLHNNLSHEGESHTLGSTLI